jgi:hypothetical protein
MLFVISKPLWPIGAFLGILLDCGFSFNNVPGWRLGTLIFERIEWYMVLEFANEDMRREEFNGAVLEFATFLKTGLDVTAGTEQRSYARGLDFKV